MALSSCAETCLALRACCPWTFAGCCCCCCCCCCCLGAAACCCLAGFSAGTGARFAVTGTLAGSDSSSLVACRNSLRCLCFGCSGFACLLLSCPSSLLGLAADCACRGLSRASHQLDYSDSLSSCATNFATAAMAVCCSPEADNMILEEGFITDTRLEDSF